jgi:hypothetical protein
VQEALPLRFVDSLQFRALLGYLHPRALGDVPGRNTLQKRIGEEYETLKVQLIERIAQSKGKVAVLVDAWTSRNQCGLFAIMCTMRFERAGIHEYETVLLDMVPSTVHTGDASAEMVNSVLFNFGVPLSRVNAVVCDNASANKRMVEKLNTYLADDEIPISPVFCFAHSLHRVVLKMLCCLRSELQTLRRFVRSLHHSNQASEHLCKQVEDHDRNYPEESIGITRIPMDVRTCWNSTYRMLQCALQMRKVLQLEERTHGLNSAYFNNSKKIIQFLEPFATASTQMCRQDSMLAEVIPLYNCLIDKLKDNQSKISPARYDDFVLKRLQGRSSMEALRRDTSPELSEAGGESAGEDGWDENDDDSESSEPPPGGDFTIDEVIGAMCRSSWGILTEHYGRANNAAVAALVLNPKYNISYCKRSQWENRWIEHAQRMVMEIYKHNTGREENSLMGLEFLGVAPEAEAPIIIRTMRTASIEMEDYMGMPQMAPRESPLDLWLRLKSTFPRVHKIALDYLGVPATTAAVERLFSICGNYSTPKRSRMCRTAIKTIRLREKRMGAIGSPKSLLERKKRKGFY